MDNFDMIEGKMQGKFDYSYDDYYNCDYDDVLEGNLDLEEDSELNITKEHFHNKNHEFNKKLSYYNCPQCFSRVTKDANFCSSCGTNLNHKHSCSKCGGSMVEGAVYCHICGNKL